MSHTFGMELKVIMNYPQACHNTSILPLFPRIEEVPREVIWDSFSKMEVPNDVVYNLGYQKVFSDEDPSKVQDPFSLHDSFFVKNDKALLYKQGWFYTKGSSYLLPVRCIVGVARCAQMSSPGLDQSQKNG